MPEKLFTALMQAGVKVIDRIESMSIVPENMLMRKPPKVVAKVISGGGVAYRITVQEWVEPEVVQDEDGRRF